MKAELVKASSEDKAFLLKLRKLTMVEHLERAGLYLSDEEHEFRLNDAFDCSHIVVYSGVNIGLAKFRESAGKLEILQIQILPEYQGMGLGRRLTEELISTARSKGLKVVLTVLKNNPAAKLYESLGFKIAGEDDYEFFMELLPMITPNRCSEELSK